MQNHRYNFSKAKSVPRAIQTPRLFSSNQLQPRHDHPGVQVSRWRDRCRGLACHSRFLHRIADSQEGDRNKPVLVGHNGGRCGRLSILGACVGQAVPRLRATKQRAHIGGGSFQAFSKHGLFVQEYGFVYGHHDRWLGQACKLFMTKEKVSFFSFFKEFWT